VDWDTNPGVREVQAITTSTYLGPNEIQAITTYAPNINEIQYIKINATSVREVQMITVSGATSGFFFVTIDTSATGGSIQYSGNIGVNYLATGSYLAVDRIISAMSNISPFGSVNVSRIVVSASIYQYLITFPAAMGNVPQITSTGADLTPQGLASVAYSTITNGNVIGGSFTLTFDGATTAAIATDASENDMRLALEALPGIATVAVSRSSPDFQLGYTWTVEFTSSMNSGNVDNLIPDYANLTVSSASAIAVATVTSIDGNQLGGFFSLTYMVNGFSNSTMPIPFNASPDVFKAAIENLTMIPPGTTAVNRIGPDLQLGYTWTVTFLSNYQGANQGSLQLFTTSTAALTGKSAGMQVVKVRDGTFKEVQKITVSTTSSSLDYARMMSLQFNGQSSSLIKVRPSGNVCISSITEVQTITSSTIDTTALGGDFDVSLYLQFKLSYGSEVTGLINANPSGTTVCSASAAQIQSELQMLPSFYQVSVLGVSTGPTQGCTWTVIFLSSIGDVAQLNVESYNSASLSLGGVGISSTAGDDTVTTATLVDGEKDAIKAELERLSTIGSVTVTAVNVNQVHTSVHDIIICL
jgi:hypothetical protein